MCKSSNCVLHTQKETLHLLCFNVEGLNSTFEDPVFSQLVAKHDICLFTETWKGDDTKIDCAGFWDYHQIRPKHRKAIRHSGGVSVLVKDELRHMSCLATN
jgi:exonuclease III